MDYCRLLGVISELWENLPYFFYISCEIVILVCLERKLVKLVEVLVDQLVGQSVEE